MKTLKDRDLIYFEFLENGFKMNKEDEEPVLQFKCYCDGDKMFTYGYEDNHIKMELCLISEEDTWFDFELLHELVFKKNLVFIDLVIWEFEEKVYDKKYTL